MKTYYRISPLFDAGKLILFFVILIACNTDDKNTAVLDKPRIIVTSDGEIDDQCSMIRFLLYTNEWDVEGIITSSSQYHWHGHNWAGDDWIEPDLDAYAKVYPNLVMHDSNFPTPEYLRSVTFLGNVEVEGEMDSIGAAYNKGPQEFLARTGVDIAPVLQLILNLLARPCR